MLNRLGKKTVPVVVKFTRHGIHENSCDSGDLERSAFLHLFHTKSEHGFFPVVKLLAYAKTAHSHVFFLQKCEMDVLSFLQTREPNNIYLQSKCCFLMARALFELHRRNVGHGDVSPENFMLITDETTKTKSIVLIDLACAQIHLDVTKKAHVNVKGETNCMDGKSPGKVNFRCPEVDLHEPWSLTKNDLFGFAVVVYAVMTGEFPFDLENDAHDKNEEIKRRRQFIDGLHGNHLHSSYRDFSSKLMDKTFFDTELMGHPFLFIWQQDEKKGAF